MKFTSATPVNLRGEKLAGKSGQQLRVENGQFTLA